MIEITNFSIYTLTKPIQVEVNEISGHFYASNDEYEIYSDGDTEERAIDNFKEYLEETYCIAKKLMEIVNE